MLITSHFDCYNILPTVRLLPCLFLLQTIQSRILKSPVLILSFLFLKKIQRLLIAFQINKVYTDELAFRDLSTLFPDSLSIKFQTF